jgi:hypothetical protein
MEKQIDPTAELSVSKIPKQSEGSEPQTPLAKAIALAVGILLCAGAATWLTQCQEGRKASWKAMKLAPANSKFSQDAAFSPSQVVALLESTTVEPLSSSSGPVIEPPLKTGASVPPDLDRLGYGKSSFLVDTPWATIRYVGESPAGAGLTGKALDDAQKKALGTANDTIPVVTSALTINDMMDTYFSPLLKTLPSGNEILRQIKVQGAYYSPDHDFGESSESKRDNAFIVGLQSLYMYPSSCFDRKEHDDCQQQFYSTGHDPTIIGHELGHVVFNQLRNQKSIEGFQWTAVNEGYADYFAASYFSEPVMGRTWKVNRSSSPSLRRLIDNPTTSDPEANQDAHKFSVVWSSALWRIRNRIIQEKQAKSFEIDRMFLHSIVFLGETAKIRFGDGAVSVIKAAEILGHPDWKDIMREEFQASEIALDGESQVSAIRKDSDAQKNGPIKASKDGMCGVIGSQGNSNFSSFSVLIPLLLPLGLLLFQRLAPSWISMLLAMFFFSGCKTPMGAVKGAERPNPPGPTLVYVCYPDKLDGKSSSKTKEKSEEIYLSWLPSPDGKKDAEKVLISDARYERALSSIVVLLDPRTRRVDQIRTREGRAFELSVEAKLISSDEADALRNARIATMILEGAARALHKGSTSPVRGAKSSAFNFESKKLFLSPQTLNGPTGYGPLPKEVSTDEKSESTLCRFDRMIYP